MTTDSRRPVDVPSVVMATAAPRVAPMAITPSAIDASGPTVGGAAVSSSDTDRATLPPPSAIQVSSARVVTSPMSWESAIDHRHCVGTGSHEHPRRVGHALLSPAHPKGTGHVVQEHPARIGTLVRPLEVGRDGSQRRNVLACVG